VMLALACLIELLEGVGAKGCDEFSKHRLREIFRRARSLPRG
jgi:hypothetical protein